MLGYVNTHTRKVEYYYYSGNNEIAFGKTKSEIETAVCACDVVVRCIYYATKVILQRPNGLKREYQETEFVLC